MDNTNEAERYRRNLLVEGFSEEQQQRLAESRITVVGAGGLGSAALNYLVAAGVGFIRIIENDFVSLSNLQRQILYTTDDLGRAKASAATDRLSRINPQCQIDAVTDRLDTLNAETLLSGSQLVIDCTDNYATRYVIDDFCSARRVPMIYGTAEQIGVEIPQEIAETLGLHVLYPENWAAGIAARHQADPYLQTAEGQLEFSNDICAYAKVNLAYAEAMHEGGDLVLPDFLLCANNICNQLTKWYERLAFKLNIPLFFIDCCYNAEDYVTESRVRYIRAQIDEVIKGLGGHG